MSIYSCLCLMERQHLKDMKEFLKLPNMDSAIWDVIDSVWEYLPMSEIRKLANSVYAEDCDSTFQPFCYCNMGKI